MLMKFDLRHTGELVWVTEGINLGLNLTLTRTEGIVSNVNESEFIK